MEQKQLWTIYIAINRVNYKCYIGLTSNLQRRMNQHKHSVKSRKKMGQHFTRAIAKYGYDMFSWYTLSSDIPTIEIADEKEIYYIKHFKENGIALYNHTEGGTNGQMIDDRTRDKLSNISKKWWNNASYRRSVVRGLKQYYIDHPKLKNEVSKRMKEYWANNSDRHISVEVRGKMSIRAKEYWDNNYEMKEQFRLASTNRWKDSNYRDKVVPKVSKQWDSSERRINQGQKMKIYHNQHPEHGKKNSERLKQYWADPENKRKHRERMQELYSNEDYKKEHAEKSRRSSLLWLFLSKNNIDSTELFISAVETDSECISEFQSIVDKCDISPDHIIMAIDRYKKKKSLNN